MRKRLCLLLALLLLLGLTGCAVRPVVLPESTLIPGTAPFLPEASLGESVERRETATLWFRCGDLPYLAQESRSIALLTGQSYEMALLEALFSGPGTQHPTLRTLFPEGTRVLSAVVQGRTLLVTLSGEFVNQPGDEPVDWQEDGYWRVEVPLRRRLAMQSLVATVTENCDVDEVLVLVEQPEGFGGSLRLRQNWFEDDSEDNVLTGPQRRDDSLLLTPRGTVEAVARCYMAQDWLRLYAFMESGTDERSFVETMGQLPAVTAVRCNGCSVTPDGQEATATVDLTVLGAGGEARTVKAHVFRIRRENGLWKVSLEQLMSWVEE